MCLCVSQARAVISCLASTHTALVSSPSLTVLHLPTLLPTYLPTFCLALGGPHTDLAGGEVGRGDGADRAPLVLSLFLSIPTARPAMCARASPERSHLRTWPACSWLVPPILHPTALATEGEGQQYTTTTASHTPRWPAPSAPHGPAQPSLPHPRLQCLQIKPSHLSSSANAAAAPRQRPGRLADLHAQPCPPLPTRLDRSADSSTSSHHRVSCHEA